jgi:hypothetical protein
MEYDSPPPFVWALSAFGFLPPVLQLSAEDSHGVSRFSRMVFLDVLGVFDSAGPTSHSRLRAPSCCLPGRSTPSAPWISVFGAQWPARLYPCPTLQVRPCGPPSHGSGPRWVATPFLYDSCIHNTTPVYPDAIRTITSRTILDLNVWLRDVQIGSPRPCRASHGSQADSEPGIAKTFDISILGGFRNSSTAGSVALPKLGL